MARERDEGLPGWSIVSASLADYEIFKNEPTVNKAEEKKGRIVSRTTRRFLSSTSKRNAG